MLGFGILAKNLPVNWLYYKTDHFRLPFDLYI